MLPLLLLAVVCLSFFTVIRFIFRLFGMYCFGIYASHIYISSAFSLMPFHVIQYVVIRNADEYALKPYVQITKDAGDAKQLIRSLSFNAQCYCANTLCRQQEPEHSSGMKKSTKTIKRCNVILLVFLSALLPEREWLSYRLHMRCDAMRGTQAFKIKIETINIGNMQWMCTCQFRWHWAAHSIEVIKLNE